MVVPPSFCFSDRASSGPRQRGRSNTRARCCHARPSGGRCIPCDNADSAGGGAGAVRDDTNTVMAIRCSLKPPELWNFNQGQAAAWVTHTATRCTLGARREQSACRDGNLSGLPSNYSHCGCTQPGYPFLLTVCLTVPFSFSHRLFCSPGRTSYRALRTNANGLSVQLRS
jgi:hypothetical protein